MELSGEGVQLDLKVGMDVVVHVALDDGVAGAVGDEGDLPHGGERVLSDERERLVSRGIDVGIDEVKVDDVCAEILDHVAVVRADAGIEGREARTGEHERVLTASAGQAIAVAGASNQYVIAGA